MKYIYQQRGWPGFIWDAVQFIPLLARLHHRQGQLLGKMVNLGFKLRTEAILDTLTLDIVKSSEIEGEILDQTQVRSSIAKRLGLEITEFVPVNRDVEGVVEMMLDATQHFDQPLTRKRLFDWHASLFPTGRSGMHKIIVGEWRNDSQDPIQVISGPFGKEIIHFSAPDAKIIETEMEQFLSWFNQEYNVDSLIKAAIAHLWFVTIHPFEDGNGRIARTITDMQLSRSDNSSQRFYSMSAQIRKEREEYYAVLERTQKNSLDITDWLSWFLDCFERALMSTEVILENVMNKAYFWKSHPPESFNERQRLMIDKLLYGFTGKLTSTKWAKIMRCSQDTALRDIQDLLARKILIKDEAGGRSTSYFLSK